MELTHRFTVPTSVEETWEHFNDIASVAECFPGAQVTGAEGDTFQGTVKVKLGPIALQYTGHGTFVEKDDAAHRFVVDAKGKDKRGNGTAGAMVTLTMEPSGSATDVQVVTDLAVTGKPAQFGRGVMQDVSDKLLGQFVSCLEHRLALGEDEAEAPAEAAAPEAAAAPEPAVTPVAETPAAETPAPAPAPKAAPAPAAPTHRAAPPQDDAIDLGSTVLPVLVRAYWKPVAGGVVALVVLWWLIRRFG